MFNRLVNLARKKCPWSGEPTILIKCVPTALVKYQWNLYLLYIVWHIKPMLDYHIFQEPLTQDVKPYVSMLIIYYHVLVPLLYSRWHHLIITYI